VPNPLGEKMREKQEATLISFIEAGRQELGKLPSPLIAERCGIEYSASEGEFQLEILGQNYRVSYPSFVARRAGEQSEAPLWFQALIIHYCTTADGASLAGEWVSLRQVPGGLFYEQAFQGYTGDRLASFFGNDLERFRAAARRVGGLPEDMGDAAFSFLPLPRIPMAIVYWLGDEEFPPSAQLLFDSSVSHYLPIGALTPLAARLSGMLIKEAK